MHLVLTNNPKTSNLSCSKSKYSFITCIYFSLNFIFCAICVHSLLRARIISDICRIFGGFSYVTACLHVFIQHINFNQTKPPCTILETGYSQSSYLPMIQLYWRWNNNCSCPCYNCIEDEITTVSFSISHKESLQHELYKVNLLWFKIWNIKNRFSCHLKLFKKNFYVYEML